MTIILLFLIMYPLFVVYSAVFVVFRVCTLVARNKKGLFIVKR